MDVAVVVVVVLVGGVAPGEQVLCVGVAADIVNEVLHLPLLRVGSSFVVSSTVVPPQWYTCLYCRDKRRGPVIRTQVPEIV